MTRSHRFTAFLTIVGLGLLLGLTACSSTHTPGEQVDDAWITSKITAKFTADPAVNPFEIDVDTDQGNVRLSGMVETERQRSEAVEIARNTQGVKSVTNEIKLGDPTFEENVDDGWISTKVKAKIAADPDVNKFNIDVDVQQKTVTLTGTVRTEYARDHAGELASSVKGVKSVDNRIKVKQ